MPKFKTLFILSAFIVFFACLPLRLLADEPLSHFILDNGMEVLIKPLHTQPSVSVNLALKTGTAYETEEEQGYFNLIARLFEANNESLSKTALQKELAILGVEQYSLVANDYVCHSTTGSSIHLDKILSFVADNFFYYTFEEELIKREFALIKENSLLNLISPQEQVMQILMSEAFLIHPYKNPVTPDYQDTDSIDIQALIAFYNKYYVPSNICLTVVGDIEEGDTIDSIRKTFSSVQRKDAPTKAFIEEPPQTKLRAVYVTGDTEQTHIAMGWKVPGISSEDRYPLFVLSQILGASRSSMLWGELIEGKSLADWVGSAYYLSRDPMLFQVAVVASPSNARKCIEYIRELIATLKDSPTLDYHLKIAKQAIVASDIFAQESFDARALHYASYAVISNHEEAEDFILKIRNVSSEQIIKVINRYFIDKNLSIALLEPTPPSSDSLPLMLTLDNGIRLIFKQNHSLPIISASIKVAAGQMYQPFQNPGLAYLVANAIGYGSFGNSRDLRKCLAEFGSEYTFEVNENYASFNIKSLTESFEPSFVLLIEALANFDLIPSELVRLKADALLNSKEEEDSIGYFTIKSLLNELYEKSPVQFSLYGTDSAMQKIQLSTLKEFHKKNYVGSNMVIAVTGNVYPDEIRDSLLKILGKLDKGTPAKPQSLSFATFAEPPFFRYKKNQNIALYAYMVNTFPQNHLLFPATEVAISLLDSGISTKLYDVMLKEDGLIRMRQSKQVVLLNSSYFYTLFATSLDCAEDLKELFELQLNLIKQDEITPEEVEKAKQFILSQHAVSIKDTLSMADRISHDEMMGLGFDYYFIYPSIISQVPFEDVRDVMFDHLVYPKTWLSAITTP